MKRLVGDYKYFSEVASCRPIAKLAAAVIGKAGLPGDIVIVPITTVPAHVRQRGFDHMLLVAHQLKKLLHPSLPQASVNTKLLARTDNSAQHELSGSERQQKIKQSLVLNQCYLVHHPAPRTVLLVDDIFTTGATMSHAAKLLRKAGTQKVIGLTILRQPKE